MKKSLRNAALAVCVLAMVAAVSYTAGARQAGKPVNTPVAELKWEPYSPGDSLMVASLWGDRTKSFEYGMLVKLPSGYQSGRHTHAADFHGVTVQGTWVHANEGDPSPAVLRPGSYVFQPARQIHSDTCRGGQECIILVTSLGPADFIVAR